MTRGRKKPGRILFVGSGPGDPGLLTVRARAVLTGATVAFTDPDVPQAVLDLVGSAVELPEPAPAKPATGGDEAPAAANNEAAAEPPLTIDIRPALGDPADVAKTLVAEARSGVDVVRLVAGDPLSIDSVLAEVHAVTRTQVAFEILPGLASSTAVPAYAGLPPGSAHTVADVRGDVDWAALAAAPGPLILHATPTHVPDAAKALIEHGLADQTLVAVTAQGTTCAQRTVETTLASLIDGVPVDANDPHGPMTGALVLTIGRVVAGRSKLNWWESRALYGWTVLVPRTKDQAGEMSDKLVGTAPCPSRCRPLPSNPRAVRPKWKGL
ncbi:Possible Uroporphyrin-III C-methyltransferase [Mycobacteroides abscessus]|nr:Possible Uroporphyrin-III C-methyltransferase [Mycobacteroides abscessus]